VQLAAQARKPEAEADGIAVAVGALRGFFTAHSDVEVWEGGRRVARIGGERSGYALSCERGRLILHLWSEDANVVRRVESAEGAGGRLKLQCRRMGQSAASGMTMTAAAAVTPERRSRGDLREAAAAAAERTWRGWRCDAGGGGTRSPWQRLRLRKPQRMLAVVAGDADTGGGLEALAAALTWAAELRRRHPQAVLEGVRVILRDGGAPLIGRLRPWLRQPQVDCFRLDRAAEALEPLPMEDDNRVPLLRRAPAADELAEASAAELALLREVREFCPQAVWETRSDGGRRISVYGLEVAGTAVGAEARTEFQFGCGREQSPLDAAARPLFHQLLREVACQRVAGQDRRYPYYAAQPERWLQNLLQGEVGCLDPQVDGRRAYRQVSMSEPGRRDFVDLLGVDRSGRLLAIELKAEEDLAFPLQGLAYWQRVRQHQAAGDFERLGYFPGVALSSLPPRLWLVAPALRWHPRSDDVMGWIAPEVPWTRIGLNEEWRHSIQVVYRKEAEHG
jgi:hypothetical protein